MSLSQQVHVDIDSFDKTVIYYDLKVDRYWPATTGFRSSGAIPMRSLPTRKSATR
jgi:hypothetical protein